MGNSNKVNPMSLCMHIASLLGRVHGVVVQITVLHVLFPVQRGLLYNDYLNSTHGILGKIIRWFI